MMTSVRILGAAIVALLLSILPLPGVVALVRPAWVLLLLLYLQAYLPNYFNVFMVLGLGLCLDVLSVTPMGEHAFALIITTWLMVGCLQRFIFYSVVQQMLMIAVASCCYQFIVHVADASFGYSSPLYPVFGVALSSMLCWPLLLGMTFLQGSHYRHDHTVIERFSR